MNKPYPMKESKARKSPMKTMVEVKRVLNDYESGVKIGFSRAASLKSMGLIPRSDGKYRLGEKYKS